MAYTWAGAQSWANRPPLTPESRLRMVLIWVMSAPQASIWPVMSSSSARGTRGRSNRAEPPPDTRNSTRSLAQRPLTAASAASVARTECSSGTGWPAS